MTLNISNDKQMKNKIKQKNRIVKCNFQTSKKYNVGWKVICEFVITVIDRQQTIPFLYHLSITDKLDPNINVKHNAKWKEQQNLIIDHVDGICSEVLKWRA